MALWSWKNGNSKPRLSRYFHPLNVIVLHDLLVHQWNYEKNCLEKLEQFTSAAQSQRLRFRTTPETPVKCDSCSEIVMYKVLQCIPCGFAEFCETCAGSGCPKNANHGMCDWKFIPKTSEKTSVSQDQHRDAVEEGKITQRVNESTQDPPADTLTHDMKSLMNSSKDMIENDDAGESQREVVPKISALFHTHQGPKIFLLVDLGTELIYIKIMMMISVGNIPVGESEFTGIHYPWLTSLTLSEIDEADFFQLCKESGPIVYTRLVTDETTGVSTGLGYAVYENKDAAAWAIKDLEDRIILGQSLNLEVSLMK